MKNMIMAVVLSTFAFNSFANTLKCTSADVFDTSGKNIIQAVNLNGKTTVQEKDLSIVMTSAKGVSVEYLKDYNVWRPINGEDTLVHNPGSYSFKLYTIHFNKPVLIDFHCF